MENCSCIYCNCKELVPNNVAWCDKCRYDHNESKHRCQCAIPDVGQYLPFNLRPLFAMYCRKCKGKLLH